ncbi:MAG: hypothetical protein ACE5GJ_09155 [Gemmatimonadota bacterium]
MSDEARIETRIIRNRESALGVQDSLYIRCCAMGPGFGVADLVLLPQRGKHKLVIVEAKQASSADARIKVVGQLLMYYAGALKMGLGGLKLLRRYAVDHHVAARRAQRSSLQAISGGITPRNEAWAALRKGRRLRPDNIRLLAALTASPALPLSRL